MNKLIKKKGFTLAELLVVVAIIAILVAVSIPVFAGQKEKAARATDMANARAIKSCLANMVLDGTAVFPAKSEQKTIGMYVVVAKDNKSLPGSYALGNSNVVCAVNSGVTINGVTSTSWSEDNTALRKAMKDYGIDVDNLVSESNIDKTLDGIGGWDWYIIEYAWDETSKSFETRIYSGKAGSASGMDSVKAGSTNIEKYMNK